MENVNILVLSVGRRVELIQCFKNAAKKLNIESKIIGADISNTAPAIYYTDKHYLIPRIGENGYIEKIIEICNNENIKAVIPTIDTELLILSQNKKIIEEKTEAKVIVSDYDVISVCRNKIKTQKFFETNGFGAPKRITELDENDAKFPLFIKPLDGSSSINTFKVKNADELKFFKNYIKKPIIQELVEGKEYTIDAFCDFSCNPITIVPRQRVAVRNGEILKGKIVKDGDLIENVKKLLNILKPIGQVTIQCIKNDQKINYIEINPRFGGGAPMSIMAGADSCENIYKLLLGKKLEYNEEYKDNIMFLRFDNSIMLNENMEPIDNV